MRADLALAFAEPSGQLEVKVTIDAEEASDGVVERAIVGRRGILLNIARIKMIQHVVECDSRAELYAMAAKFEVHRIL